MPGVSWPSSAPALSPWVETSCRNFLPSLLPLVSSLPVIYARSIFEQQGDLGRARLDLRKIVLGNLDFWGATIWEVYSRQWLLVPLVFKDDVSAEWDLESWDIVGFLKWGCPKIIHLNRTFLFGASHLQRWHRHRRCGRCTQPKQAHGTACDLWLRDGTCPVTVVKFMVIFTYFHSVHGWSSIFLRFTQITVNFIMFHHLPYLGKLHNKWIEGEFPWISRW